MRLGKERFISLHGDCSRRFGPQRMMFSSDWPVARLAIEYGPWVEMPSSFPNLVKVNKA